MAYNGTRLMQLPGSGVLVLSTQASCKPPLGTQDNDRFRFPAATCE
jgi:hypothetical protein